MKYVLNWNDEYLDMMIVCGPLDEETAKQVMKKEVINRLVKLDVAKNIKAAEEMYLAAENASAKDEIYELRVSPSGATILYGTGYEDRCQIVDYGQKTGESFGKS